MKSFLLLLTLTIFAYADMGKIINLELFDNQNPAIISDIEDERDHVVVNLSFAYNEQEQNLTRLNTRQQQYYNAAVKFYRRFDEVVFYLNGFHTIRGVQSDPRDENVPDVNKEYSLAQMGMATTIFDDIDLGISYAYEITDSNTTERTAQFGVRYVSDINLAAVVGERSHEKDQSVENGQMFYRIGASVGEASHLLFDMSVTYREQSISQTSGGLLANSQPRTYEGTMQLQGNEDFLRGGFRFDYKKSFPLVAGELPSYTRKLRYHRGMKVQREENAFSIFFLSYERKEQGFTIDHEIAMGVSLRGFYD